MREPDPVFDQWVERAKSADMVQVAEKAGAALKKVTSSERAGPCPACGGADRFSINTKSRLWNCRGAEGGEGAISLVMHAQSCSFLDAVEIITGEPRPKNAHDEADEERHARERRTAKVKADAEVRERKEAKAAEFKQKRDQEAVDALLARAAPPFGTCVEDYLHGRGIHVPRRFLGDIRFCPDVDYFGYETAAQDAPLVHLATLRAMVSVIRRFGEDQEIGAHITYLDPHEPRKWVAPHEVHLPPSERRNKAKKFRKRVETLAGGMIRLGMIGDVIAIGEGIETVLSAWQLGLGADVSLGVAMSLGNLSGGSLGMNRHPTLRGPDGKLLSYQNGKPDPARPGAILPSDVERVILLGDGDSNPLVTSGHMRTAERRYRAEGRKVDICMAPAGMDWNDVLKRMAAEKPADVKPELETVAA